MEHDKLLETIRSVIEHRPDSDVSHRPEDYDLEAIVAEVNQVTGGADASGLDPEQYWRIVEKHRRP
ncbi:MULTISPECIES: hypothetical protein [Brachybacterium]|uniref:Uncharacterized protein n=1 Tax=Brachybacterium alimentarium TaxID=47845 RepID=A0A2A3YFG2_9MICO|nr:MULTISPECIES: hypothetical protein [Brachybacterium]PCC37835.1 hypothetical protein CIK66_17330 [Brachybacterium alimentarium]RCS63807.1 hypothetical protein CIK81_11405 [Brachybacterium sp. JB7]RCS75243.1 hypothetical protein CIK70_17395 [Brachybacterium alimentarium]